MFLENELLHLLAVSVLGINVMLIVWLIMWLRQWFYPGPPVSSTNKTDRHDIAEILLKVALSTIKQTNKII
jgi:hypothetical protein